MSAAMSRVDRARAEYSHRRGRPPRSAKPARRKTSISDLPYELLAQIAGKLLPGYASAADGFLSPLDLPYRRPMNVSQREVREAYGSIPTGVKDVLNLARTCRRLRNGVSIVHDSLGGNSTSNAAFSTRRLSLYLTIPDETPPDPLTEAWVEKSEARYIQDMILSSRQHLETLALTACGHHAGQRLNYRDHCPLSSLGPWQSLFEEDSILPRLRSLQLGPDLCLRCTRSILHIFCATSFAYDRLDNPQSMKRWNFASSRFDQRAVHHDHIIAPSLRSLQIYIPTRHIGGESDANTVREILSHISEDCSLDMLQIWLPPDTHTGGFGSYGFCTWLDTTKESTIEAELEREAMKLAPSSRRAQADAKLLAKAQGTRPPIRPLSASGEKSKSKSDVAHTEESNRPEENVIVKAEPIEGGPASSSPDNLSTAMYTERVTKRTKLHLNISQILTHIAFKLPNLVGLSVLRRDGVKYDVTETVESIAAYQETFSRPVAKMDKLRFLDLGLAICGAREVTQFPLGLSVHSRASAKRKLNDDEGEMQVAKRALYLRKVKEARDEGTAYRRHVLSHFVQAGDPVGKAVPVGPTTLNAASSSVEHPAAESPEGSVDFDGSEGDQSTSEQSFDSDNIADKFFRWPVGVTSGHVYTVDLIDRGKGHGVVIPWRRQGSEIVFDKYEKVKL